jgi:hypothetical protein
MNFNQVAILPLKLIWMMALCEELKAGNHIQPLIHSGKLQLV